MAAPENIEALNFSDQKKQNTKKTTCLGITKHTQQQTNNNKQKQVVYFNGKQAPNAAHCNLPTPQGVNFQTNLPTQPYRTKYWIPKLKTQNARFVNILCCWRGVSLARVDARRVDASRQVATSLTTQDVNQDLSHL